MPIHGRALGPRRIAMAVAGLGVNGLGRENFVLMSAPVFPPLRSKMLIVAPGLKAGPRCFVRARESPLEGSPL
jgi:hypothetical protein